jgi:hypothetical protein
MRICAQTVALAALLLTGCESHSSSGNFGPNYLADEDVIRPRLSELQKGMTKEQVVTTLGLQDYLFPLAYGSSGRCVYTYDLSNGNVLSLSFSIYNSRDWTDGFERASIVTPKPVGRKDTEQDTDPNRVAE